jgi:hypothetical protein
MKPNFRWIVFLMLFLFGLFGETSLLLAVDDDSYSCMVCHGEQKVEFNQSIHAQGGILCKDCHGGDPTSLDQDAAMSPRAGFVGKLNKKQIAYLCGDCHADRKKMQSYGIPTHQLDDYKTSRHGMAVLDKNDFDAATCTDCHGTHKILKVDNSESKVFPTNVPGTCADCHANRELMAKYNLPSNIYEEFKQGIHGIYLLEKNDRSAPTCARCHGNHGALPPGVTQVEHVCGQCHSRAAEYFEQSPHQAAMENNLMAQCISCHQQHQTQPANVAMLDTVCTRCHDESSGAFKRGQQIKALLVEAQVEIDGAGDLIDKAKLKGVDITEDEVGLERSKSYLLEAVPTIHALNISLVEENTVQAKSIASDIKLRIHEILESFRLRKLVLGVVWLFILFTVTVLYIKKKRADQEFDLHQKG